jgi:hypothetical protein
MGLGDSARQRQPQSRATRTCRHEHVEHSPGNVRPNAGPIVGDFDDRPPPALPHARHDARRPRRARLDRVLVKRMKQAPEEAGVRLHDQAGRRDGVVPLGDSRRELLAGHRHRLGDDDRLGSERVASRECHHVIDDPVRGPGVFFDPRHMLKCRFGIPLACFLSCQVGVGGDDLEHVSQLMSDLDGDFAQHDQSFSRRIRAVRAHGIEGTGGPPTPASGGSLAVGLWPEAERA